MKKFLFASIFILNIFSLSAQRVYIEDNLFKVNGQPLFLNGANTPWNSWNDLGRDFDYSWWNNHFADLHAAGINSTRVWLSCDPNHQAILMDENGLLQGITDAFWEDMDSLMSIAKRHQVYVMGALMSFDHFKGVHGDAAVKWSKMLKSEENVDTFVENYAVPLVERYKDNPYLFSIDACNEIIWVSSDENNSNNAVSWENIQYYVGKVAQRIHETSDVLVCTSNYIKYSSSKYQGNKYSDNNLKTQVGDEDAYLDFYKIHYYTWVSRWFGGFHPTHTPQYYALNDKPAITGEMPANEIYAWNGSLQKDTWLMSIEKAYEISYENGWQGAMAWTSNGVDDYGNLDNKLAEATIAFKQKHPDLVYPDTSSHYLSINKNIFNIPGTDTLITLKISSNLEWTIQVDFPWIKTSNIHGTGDSIVTFHLNYNESSEPRSAELEIISLRGTKTFSLSQINILPPEANAGENISIPDLQADGVESVTLDGSQSNDLDGTITSYTWLIDDEELATGAKPEVTLQQGISQIVLVVTDDFNKKDADTIVVEIIEQVLPVANAGNDIVAADTLNDGIERITLDGTLSFDEDGEIVKYTWMQNSTEIAQGKTTQINFPVGIHNIILKVTDDIGNYSMDTITVEIKEMALSNIPSLKRDKDILIYPNPFSEILHIEYYIKKGGQIKINLIDDTGRNLKTLAYKIQLPGKQILNIDGTDIKPGIYCLQINAQGNPPEIISIVKR